MHEMGPPQKNLASYWENFTCFFPILLMNIHLKQTETFKNKARSYRIDRNLRIFTEALKYVSSKHSYKKIVVSVLLIK